MEQTLRREGGETISWEKKGGKPASRKEGRETNSEEGWKQSFGREGMETISCKRREGNHVL